VLSRRYAKALFGFATRRQVVDQVADDLQSVARLLKAEERLRAFLLSPSVATESVIDLIKTVLGPHMSPVTSNFLQLLHRKGRFDHFDEIADCYIQEVEASRGILKAVVTTAAAIDEGTEDKLRAVLEKVTGKTIRLESKVDAEVLGGVVVVLGDQLIDGSVRREIDRLREELSTVTVI
jgi:F-type H+-transporting ATPase subunit delta